MSQAPYPVLGARWRNGHIFVDAKPLVLPFVVSPCDDLCLGIKLPCGTIESVAWICNSYKLSIAVVWAKLNLKRLFLFTKPEKPNMITMKVCSLLAPDDGFAFMRSEHQACSDWVDHIAVVQVIIRFLSLSLWLIAHFDLNLLITTNILVIS